MTSMPSRFMISAIAALTFIFLSSLVIRPDKPVQTGGKLLNVAEHTAFFREHALTILEILLSRFGADIVQSPADVDPLKHLKDFVTSVPDTGQILAVVRPRSTEDVSAILALCHQHDAKVVPQGGLTGLAGGGLPVVPSVLLSLERLRAVEEVDTAAATITVQAGVNLETVQNRAEEAGFFFPLDLGGRGSCQVGGNASTNAGGNRVLRYGMMRESVLGIEAVLADGTIISSLNKMLKNNAGYDLKHLFIGTEGTLGVITRLVLKLYPKVPVACTGLCALADYDQVLKLLNRAKSHLGATLAAFEVMWPDFYQLGTVGLDRTPPIKLGHGVYVLLETLGVDEAADKARFEAVIGAAVEDGVVDDAVIAQSTKDSRALWAIRDSPGEYPRIYWPQISLDISVPTGEIGAFMVELRDGLRARWPAIRTVFFGHVADSNLHLSAKLDVDPMPVHEIEEHVYSAVGRRKGSISAEHGIGMVKREFLHYSRSPEEIALMRTLKAALDPKGILNPGKVI